MATMSEPAPTELGRFLRARREGVRPADVGLAPGAGSRRTPGLRREELATLAGVSIDYYTRLERGRETRPSPAVVDTLARALLLDPDEHEYLRSLAAQAARRAPQPPPEPSRSVRHTLTMLLETLRPNPAYVLSRTYDMLAANPGGAHLHPGLEAWTARQRNTIRYTFLHPAARELWPDWEQKARGCVAQLRAVAGSDPDAPDLAALVGELLVKSPDFGRLWGRYEVRRAGDGEKVFRHPAVGTLTLAHEILDLNRADGQRLVVYMAAPGTPDHDAMVLLDRADNTALIPSELENNYPERTRPSPSAPLLWRRRRRRTVPGLSVGLHGIYQFRIRSITADGLRASVA
jgi:transcriptional regulator with XRE-family HTH domain